MQNRIRELRKQRHMSQIYLSIELEVSQESISAYENGKCYPSFQSLLKLSEIFNCSIDYIMGLTDKNISNRNLNDSENECLSLFNRLDEINKARAISYMQGLNDKK